MKTNRYIDRAGEAEILGISIHIDRVCVCEREAPGGKAEGFCPEAVED